MVRMMGLQEVRNKSGEKNLVLFNFDANMRDYELKLSMVVIKIDIRYNGGLWVLVLSIWENTKAPLESTLRSPCCQFFVRHPLLRSQKTQISRPDNSRVVTFVCNSQIVFP